MKIPTISVSVVPKSDLEASGLLLSLIQAVMKANRTNSMEPLAHVFRVRLERRADRAMLNQILNALNLALLREFPQHKPNKVNAKGHKVKTSKPSSVEKKGEKSPDKIEAHPESKARSGKGLTEIASSAQTGKTHLSIPGMLLQNFISLSPRGRSDPLVRKCVKAMRPGSGYWDTRGECLVIPYSAGLVILDELHRLLGVTYEITG